MKLYIEIEKYFERLAHYSLKIFGSSITFLLAILLVLYWLLDRHWQAEYQEELLRDILHAIIFLSFFIIQKTFLHFSAVLNLKLNELIAAHDNARNHLVKAEDKTEAELGELAAEHQKLAEKAKTLERKATQKIRKNGKK